MKHAKQTKTSKFIQWLMAKNRIYCILLGIPALFPLICVLPDIIHRNSHDLFIGASDTLGTGAELTLLITLLITPLMVLTSKRWLFPLRKWYGVMTGIIAMMAGIISPITSIEFSGSMWNVMGDMSLVTGYLLVVLLLPLLLISNKFSAKKLGKYWPKIQKRLTYGVWALLTYHLYVLYGINPNMDGSILHQRFYLFALCSLSLVVYRIPTVKRAITNFRKLGFSLAVWIMTLPWIAFFVVPFSFIVNEEVFKGVSTIMGHSLS